MSSGNPPVLVLAPARFTGPLGVARSLGRLGVRVYALDHMEPSLVLASRYCRGRVEAGRNGYPEGRPEAEIAEQLMSAASGLGQRPILLPASDQWAALVARQSRRLSEAYTFCHVPCELVNSLISKVGLHELARRYGLPTPKTVCPTTLEEALAAAAELGFPLVLKHLVNQPGQDLVQAANPRELREGYLAMGGPGRVVLQEHIPGDDDQVWMYEGYFDSYSRCLISFTGRKVRQLPPGLGLCTTGVSEHNPQVVQAAEAFLGALSYKGLVDIDFRRDPRDGQYKVLDVNPRLGGVFRLFVDRCGLDVVRAMYLDLVGLQVPPVARRDGRRWVSETGELLALRRYRRERGLTMRAWLRSLRGLEELAAFSPSDPLPLFVAMKLLLSDTLGWRLRLLSERLRSRFVKRVWPNLAREPQEEPSTR